MEEEQRNEREEVGNLDSEGWGRYSEAELDVLLKKKQEKRIVSKRNWRNDERIQMKKLAVCFSSYGYTIYKRTLR